MGFNADQMKAITADNTTLLVSAAAGSGKTTVMIERIVRTLMEHPEKHLSGMLVITFTKEAASNMRRKLQEKLLAYAAEETLEAEKRNAAQRALDELEGAQISTIHSFCGQVMREGFHILDIDPQVRVGESAETKILFETAFHNTLNAVLDGEDPAMIAEERQKARVTVDHFTQAELLSCTQRLYSVMMGIPDPLSRTQELIGKVDLPLDEHPWVREILHHALLQMEAIPELLEQEKEAAMAIGSQPRCMEIAMEDEARCLEILQGMQQAGKPSEQIEAFLKGMSVGFAKSPLSKKIAPEELEAFGRFKEIREEIRSSKGILGKVKGMISPLVSTQNQLDNRRIREELEGLFLFMRHLHEAYRAEKDRVNVVDFSDMEQMTYTLMTDTEHPEVREGLMRRFTDIYVDESQDVSAIQNAIIRSLHHPGNHLFMVGDVKQSIYRFRHAEPALFIRYRDQYELREDAKERKIFFRENYRSSPQIIAAVNDVFTMGMNRRVNELDYEEGDRLVAGRETAFPKPRVILIREADEEKLDEKRKIEAECLAAAAQIRELMEIGRTREGEGEFRYSDICILMRSRSSVPQMVEIFRQLHIPIYYDGGGNYYELSEVRRFLSLLRTIDNLHQDIPLLGALRMMPFSFTDRELAEVRIAVPESVPFYEAFQQVAETDTPLGRRCRLALSQIAEWRLMATTMTAAEFIFRMLRETRFYSICGAYPDGKLRQSNLDMLYQKALDLENRGIYRLSEFLTLVDSVAKREDGDQPAAGDMDNCVRIMTMHKSKGLEFRAVILMRMEKKSGGQQTDPLEIDIGADIADKPALGLYLPSVNRELSTKRHTYGHDAFALRKRMNEIAEETRVLYVAMTRAMEHLVIIGTYQDDALKLWKTRNQISRIYKTRNMLDMVMAAVMAEGDLPAPGQMQPMGNFEVAVERPMHLDRLPAPEEDGEHFLQFLEEQHAPLPEWEKEEAEQYPVKTSVSSMVRAEHEHALLLRAEDMEETEEDKRRNENRLVPFLLGATAARPRFMEEAKPMARDAGTATHHFLHLVSMEAMRESRNLQETTRAELERLKAEAVLSEEEAGLVHVDHVGAFFASTLGQRFSHAAISYREWPFTLRIGSQGGTLIQGIVDAAFEEDDGWVLIDYKTDRDTNPGRFIGRHQSQMNWYRFAIQRLTGKPVREMWLFALSSGQAMHVPELDISEKFEGSDTKALLAWQVKEKGEAKWVQLL